MSIKRRFGALIAILGIVLGSMVVAAPAQAYQQQCGSYAAGTVPSFSCVAFSGFTGQRPWGYPVDANGHNCTNYVSYRLWQNGVANPGNLGHAYMWDNNASAYGIPVNSTPTVGSVAVWEPNLAGAGSTGHVAYVDAVTTSYIDVSEDNYGGTTMRKRFFVGQSDWPSHFIHFKDMTPSAPTFSGSPNSKQLTADFNGDGKTDVAAFYNYGGWHTAMWVWYGQANGMFTEPVVRWENTTGWNASFIIPAGAGDFNGDGHQDVSVYYRYETGELALWTWFGNGTGSFSAPTQSWLATTGWDGSNLRVTPTAVADYNNDGKDDIVSYFRYDGSVTRMWAWYGQSNGTFTSPVIRFEGYGWDGQRILGGGGGDFNGDGQQDVASIYRHDGGMLDINIWYGNGTGSYVSMIRAWHIPSGWEGARLISSGVADYNGDGRADLVTYYRYDDNITRMWVFYGQANGYLSAPVVRFEGFGWDGSRVIGAGTGDFNGDGHQDVASFYRHDNYAMNLNLWFGNSTGIYTSMSHSWYTPNGWDGARIVN